MAELPLFEYPTAPDPEKVVAQQLAEFGFDLTERDDVAALFIERLADAGIVLGWDPPPAPLLEAIFDPMTGAQLIVAELEDLTPFAHHHRYLVCPNCRSAENLRYHESEAGSRSLNEEATGDGRIVFDGDFQRFDDAGDDTPGIVCVNFGQDGCRIDFPLAVPDGWELDWSA